MSFSLKWLVSMCPIADGSATSSTVMCVLYLAVTGSVQGVYRSVRRGESYASEKTTRERCPWVCNLLYNVFPIHRTAKALTVCARPK